MALSSLRNISLFLIATIPFIVKYLEFKDIDKFVWNRNWIINYVVILIIFLSIFVTAMCNKNYKFVNEMDDVVAYLDTYADKDIKLYTDYSYGSIFEYNGYKPYLDTRAEVFTKKMNGKEDILDEYIRFNLDESFRDEFIKKYDFDYYAIQVHYTELVNYLINYEEIDYELILSSDKFYLVKKVS